LDWWSNFPSRRRARYWSAAPKRASGPKTSPSPEVEVVQVEQKDCPIVSEWIGTLDGFTNADVRAQVSGYILKQGYQEGAFVKQGQLLFQIDPRPFQAALDQAEDNWHKPKQFWANAEAVQRRTELDVNRYTPLAKEQAASQQDLDNAVQNNLAAKASVETAKAQIKTSEAAAENAKINLEFTRLIAPIDGIVGQAQLQVGALVSPASGPVASVSTLDPIKVYFTVSESEYLDWNRRFPTEATREEARKNLKLELVLADGSVYPRPGSVYFADRQVNINTGAIRIAGLFQILATSCVPALRESESGGESPEGRVARSATRRVADTRHLSAGSSGWRGQSKHPVGAAWRAVRQPVDCEGGVKPGERVVAEGVQKVRQGAQVKPKPFGAEAKGK